MPPGPIYNWLCVLHTASEILLHAAQIRSAQMTALQNTKLLRHAVDESWPGNKPEAPTSGLIQTKSPPPEGIPSGSTPKTSPSRPENLLSAQAQEKHESSGNQLEGIHGTLEPPETKPLPAPSSYIVQEARNPEIQASGESNVVSGLSLREKGISSHGPSSKLSTEKHDSQNAANTSSLYVQKTGVLVQATGEPELIHPMTAVLEENVKETRPRVLQASRVPSSRLGRLFHYGGLAASLGYGAATEILRRTSDSSSGNDSLIMTPANISRLVAKLSKMRGAALKLGQFLSIQDTHILPKDVEEVFRRVQDGAHYMPNWQMEKVMLSALGSSWRSNFSSFDPIPFAAASLGQVHAAVLSSHVSPTGKDESVAVKIQFPDISKSVRSDLGYLRLLLTASAVLPKGLFLDKTLNTMEMELADECNYRREADFLRLFGQKDKMGEDYRFLVPWVWDGSTDTVLVMEQMKGVSVGGTVVDRLSQEDRDEIATRILELCLRELFEFRAMQTDPNWSNFLWNEKTRQIELIDFGATREYSKEFMDNWMHLLQAAVTQDREACIAWSLKLGYLIGEEDEIMLDAHTRSLSLLATPFRVDVPRYSFGRGTEWAQITAEIRSFIPIMLRHRLTPPPRETYSLNRKLSGAFLLASRLNANVNCKGIWEDAARKYHFRG